MRAVEGHRRQAQPGRQTITGRQRVCQFVDRVRGHTLERLGHVGVRGWCDGCATHGRPQKGFVQFVRDRAAGEEADEEVGRDHSQRRAGSTEP